MSSVDGTGPWGGAPTLHGPTPPPLPPLPPALPPGPTVRPGTGTARFVGSTKAYWRLMIRGGLLLLVTLGIYRFWLATDQRRFLWGNTEIAGDAVEYTGTARELLIGFLIAIAVLIPIYGLLFMATLPYIGPVSSVVGFVLLALFGYFAIYRARRYRLTRTVFRGVRLHQTGSGWLYAFYSMLWWIVILLTLGLAYPWAQASLERYKMRHTFYGSARGRFAASGTSLFVKGIVMWLLVVGPLLAGLLYAIVSVNWMALGEAIEQGPDNIIGRIESASPDFAAVIAVLSLAASWSPLLAALLYPAFQAMMLRWWTSGLRFDGMAAKSHLRTGQIYGLYLRYMGYCLLLGIAIGIAAAVVAAAFGVFHGTSGEAPPEAAGIVALVIGYAVVFLAYSTVYQVVVKLRLWKLSFETAELSGLEELDAIKAAGVASSAFGEGLADALDVGGL